MNLAIYHSGREGWTVKKTEPNMRLPLPSKLLLSDIEIIKKQIFYSCPFELPAKQHRPVSPSWPNGRCCLAGNSKGHG